MSESSLYRDLVQGLQEARAYERGETEARTVYLSSEFFDIPQWKPEEIKRLRLRNSMTQRAFAQFMGVSLKTVEAWESGRNRPNGSASRLMQLIDRNADSMLYVHELK